MYLDKFFLPIDREEELVAEQAYKNNPVSPFIDNPYPCGIFAEKGLAEITFSKITVFYGGNGSGKSTLLNLIAQKLALNRIAPFNSGETFDSYVEHCEYELGYDDEGFRHRIPDGSRIITSDDIFDYMLTVRTNNEEITENREDARDKWFDLKFGKSIQLKSMEDYDALRLQILARRKSLSRRQFVNRTAGQAVRMNSNGETALSYFENRFRNDTLYCLDEPENSMSPKMQLKFMDMLREMVRYCGGQFIIATHSPFLLSMENAKIYDLDSSPVEVKNWWELENVRIYHDFFQSHRSLFEN